MQVTVWYQEHHLYLRRKYSCQLSAMSVGWNSKIHEPSIRNILMRTSLNIVTKKEDLGRKIAKIFDKSDWLTAWSAHFAG